MKILLFGSSGFLGRHIASECRQRQLACVPAGGRSQGFDLRDAKAVRALLSAELPTIILNCAAYGVNPREQDAASAKSVNTEAPLQVLDLAHELGISSLFHVGSCFEYGPHEEAISESAALRPVTLYGATKAAGSRLLQQGAPDRETHVTIMRPFGFWGPGEADFRLVPQVLSACRHRRALDLTPGQQIRDLSYVKDMARWIVSLITKPLTLPTGSVVNVGCGQGISIRDFALSLARPLHGEKFLKFGALPYRAHEMMSIVADNTIMKKILGSAQSAPTDPNTAIQDLLASDGRPKA